MDAMLQMDWFVSSLLPYIGGFRDLRSFAVANKANLAAVRSLTGTWSMNFFPTLPRDSTHELYLNVCILWKDSGLVYALLCGLEFDPPYDDAPG